MRPRSPKVVVSFSTTEAAMECERLCHEGGVRGRIIPTPVAIKADCGLAWMAPLDARDDVEGVIRGLPGVAAVSELEL